MTPKEPPPEPVVKVIGSSDDPGAFGGTWRGGKRPKAYDEPDDEENGDE